jgi:hypothetical protein
MNVARDAAGKSRGESPEEIMAVALGQPHRRFAQTPREVKLGYPLGRLCLAGYVTEKQHDAGQRWATIVRRYSALMGFRLENPATPTIGMISSGSSCLADPDEQVILALRRDYNDAYAALEQAGRDTRTGRGPLKICRQICVQEMNEAILWPHRIGDLRVGLNALTRVLK